MATNSDVTTGLVCCNSISTNMVAKVMFFGYENMASDLSPGLDGKRCGNAGARGPLKTFYWTKCVGRYLSPDDMPMSWMLSSGTYNFK